MKKNNAFYCLEIENNYLTYESKKWLKCINRFLGFSHTIELPIHNVLKYRIHNYMFVYYLDMYVYKYHVSKNNTDYMLYNKINKMFILNTQSIEWIINEITEFIDLAKRYDHATARPGVKDCKENFFQTAMSNRKKIELIAYPEQD